MLVDHCINETYIIKQNKILFSSSEEYCDKYESKNDSITPITTM